MTIDILYMVTKIPELASKAATASSALQRLDVGALWKEKKRSVVAYVEEA